MRQSAAVTDAALPAAIPAELIDPNGRQVWDGLSMHMKRPVPMDPSTMTILPAESGHPLDPDTVRITKKV